MQNHQNTDFLSAVITIAFLPSAMKEERWKTSGKLPNVGEH